MASTVRGENKERMRARIVDAAVDAFAEHGFRTTTMSHIAERAGVGRATLYLYYSGKAKIADEIARSLQPRMIEVLKTVPGPEQAGLEAWLDELLSALRSFGTVAAVVNEAIGHNRELARTLVESMREASTVIAPRLGRRAAPEDHGALAMLLTATVLLTATAFGPTPESDDDANKRDLARLWACFLE
jgi:AcrR family transcriptional regulator